MKKHCFFLVLNLISISMIANEIQFLDQVSHREYALFGDGIKAFGYLYQLEVTDDFQQNLQLLKTKMKKMPPRSKETDILTIADFSLLAIQYLEVKSGLFYLITRSGRYASRELILLEIIPEDSTEWDKISGLQLIRLLQKVIEYEKNML